MWFVHELPTNLLLLFCRLTELGRRHAEAATEALAVIGVAAETAVEGYLRDAHIGTGGHEERGIL